MRIAESVSHRIFERILRPLVFRRACLFECHETSPHLGFCLSGGVLGVALPKARLKNISTLDVIRFILLGG